MVTRVSLVFEWLTSWLQALMSSIGEIFKYKRWKLAFSWAERLSAHNNGNIFYIAWRVLANHWQKWVTLEHGICLRGSMKWRNFVQCLSSIFLLLCGWILVYICFPCKWMSSLCFLTCFATCIVCKLFFVGLIEVCHDEQCHGYHGFQQVNFVPWNEPLNKVVVHNHNQSSVLPCLS